MKAITKTIGVLFLFLVSLSSFAQRTITGTVYNNGEPAGGIQVDAHKSNDSYYTSFDGKYQIKVSDKTKYLRFTFLDESKKLMIDENASDVINFSWDGGEIPSADDEAGVILKSLEQLMNDHDFLNPYSLYREFFKQDDYKSAYPQWKMVYKTYPKSTAQIYIDGLKMMESYLDHALNTDVKKAYLDTMMQIYDKRMKYMDNVGELMGRKAAKYMEIILTRIDGLPEDEFNQAIKKGYGFAEKSIEESGDKAEPTVIVLFMQSAKKLYSSNALTQTALLDNYEQAIKILDKQLKSGDTKDKALQAIPLVEQIIESSGALDCDAMVKLYSPKIKESPNDIELIKKILKMFRKNDCDNPMVVKLSEKLYELEPSAEAAYNMARTFLKKQEYTKTFDYYQKAYTVETNAAQKAIYYYEAAGLALQQNMLQKARDLDKEALKLNSDYCEAYQLMGEIFAQASKGYSDDDFERSTVFWLAVDYFNKAARYANCKQDASSKASFYQNYFPNKEDVFFHSLSEGNSHSLGGWINETTTVRVKPQ